MVMTLCSIKMILRRIGSMFVGNVKKKDILTMSMEWEYVLRGKVFFVLDVWVLKFQISHRSIISLI